jgi:Sec-independent protein translocase protein TatA
VGELTPWEIVLLVCGLLLGLATIINTIGSAIEKVAKAKKALKAPNDEQDRRITSVENDVEKIKGFLNSDNDRLTALERGTSVWMRGMLALLGHGLDGNNQKEMAAAKKELEEYLINR